MPRAAERRVAFVPDEVVRPIEALTWTEDKTAVGSQIQAGRRGTYCRG